MDLIENVTKVNIIGIPDSVFLFLGYKNNDVVLDWIPSEQQKKENLSRNTMRYVDKKSFEKDYEIHKEIKGNEQ